MNVEWWGRWTTNRKYTPHAVEIGSDRTVCGETTDRMGFLTTKQPEFGACSKCVEELSVTVEILAQP